ncbi:vomeronasal type-2 receptor 26-like [Rhinatrema bivittatum]|uniref:vomeronasal type-2 receptor 26-like n=1 Tax=Rhinatrema bivittatum TaxID=194408 RepID=UPI0011262642|nr:vomeronasal type-2 receptor 26-like [Rhinatrema bivittatum]
MVFPLALDLGLAYDDSRLSDPGVAYSDPLVSDLGPASDDSLAHDSGLAPVSTCSESCGPGFRKAILEGQPACCFDCVPCSEDEFSNQTDATECMKCPDDQWPTRRQDGCQKKTIEFLSYQEPLGIVLAVISVLGALMPAAILVVFIQNRHTPVVKANNRELSYLLLLALILSFGCSLVFIGHPTTLTCMVRQMAFGIVFVICISCLLAKTIMVVIAFKATKPTSNLKLWVGPRLPNTMVLACSLVQVLICVTWLIVAPPFFQMSMKSQMGKIVLECNEGLLAAFCCMLGYMGLLSTISFIVAFLARKLPDSFNEAKFITFSMLIFIAVWLSFIPAYLSTTGKYTVAVEIFAILSSSAGLLVCIFFPKCYIILIRPDMNTKQFLMGKAIGSLKHKFFFLGGGTGTTTLTNTLTTLTSTLATLSSSLITLNTTSIAASTSNDFFFLISDVRLVAPPAASPPPPPTLPPSAPIPPAPPAMEAEEVIVIDDDVQVTPEVWLTRGLDVMEGMAVQTVAILQDLRHGQQEIIELLRSMAAAQSLLVMSWAPLGQPPSPRHQ